MDHAHLDDLLGLGLWFSQLLLWEDVDGGQVFGLVEHPREQRDVRRLFTYVD